MNAQDIEAGGVVADELLTFLALCATPEQSVVALSIALGRVCDQFKVDLDVARSLVERSFNISKGIG